MARPIVTQQVIKNLGRLFIELGQLNEGIGELREWGGEYDIRASLRGAVLSAMEIRKAHVEERIRKLYGKR